MPGRTDCLITLGAADALWVDLTADSAVPTASGAFTRSPAHARVGYVLLGGHVVATVRASGGQWSVPEVEVRRAAAELNAVGMDRQDLVRIGPFRGAPRQEYNEETPLRWRRRITWELQEPGGPARGQHDVKSAGRTIWRGSTGDRYSWSRPATGRSGRGGCRALWSGCWMRPSTPKRSGCKPHGPARQAQLSPSRPPTPGRPETPAVGRRRAPRAPPPHCARTTRSCKASCTRCSAGSPVPPAGWPGGPAPSAALRPPQSSTTATNTATSAPPLPVLQHTGTPRPPVQQRHPRGEPLHTPLPHRHRRLAPPLAPLPRLPRTHHPAPAAPRRMDRPHSLPITAPDPPGSPRAQALRCPARVLDGQSPGAPFLPVHGRRRLLPLRRAPCPGASPLPRSRRAVSHLAGRDGPCRGRRGRS